MTTTTNPEHDIPTISIEEDAVTLESLLSTDYKGDSCIPEMNLDAIWPRDDREPLLVVGKGLVLPPTCEEQIPCYQKYGDEVCMKFVFNGSGVDANVDILDPGSLYISIFAAAIAAKIMRWV